MRDRKKSGPASEFTKLRNKIGRRREKLSLFGRARRIAGARKFERGSAIGRELARRRRND